MANSNSGKGAADQSRESYADDAKARRVLGVNATGDVSGGTVGTAEFVKVTDGVDTVDVITADGSLGLVTITPGHISSDNSTATILDPAGVNVFTGSSEEVVNHGVIIVSVYSDVESATDGLSVQFSTDNTNWDHTDTFTIPAGTGKTFSFQTAARYFRVMYTNGAVIQAQFRLQTILKPYYVKPSSHRVGDSIVAEDDAELAKAVITGLTPSGVFDNVKLSSENALSTTNFLFEVARGHISGIKMFSIAGRKNSISATVLDDLSEIPSTIVVPEPGGIQLEVVSSNGQDGVAGTGIVTLELHYLDSSDDEQSETIIMDGTTPVTTNATDINFIQWMHAKTVGSNGAAVGNLVMRTVGGAGTDYEYISAGGNQSLSARYKVPNGKTGYVIGWQSSGITKQVDLRLRATVERSNRALLPGVFLFQDVVVLNDSTSGWIPFDVPLMMPSGAVVKLSAQADSVGGDAGGVFDIVLVDD
jgi:hypothetical protein